MPADATLIYDGDCRFCRYTVGYARAVTGDRVDYVPYQRTAQSYPHIQLEAFRASIQLMQDGHRHQGAEAAFRTLAMGGRSGWLRLYTHLPGFAAFAEWLYGWVARHREGCYRAARLLIGPELRPAGYARTAMRVYRGTCACSAVAFASLWWQVHALVGPDGILPAEHLIRAVGDSLGPAGYLQIPTLLRISAGDLALHGLCAVGLLAALTGLAGRLRASAALVQYLCYLSLFHGGQIFLGYQWDTLLLECQIGAVLLARLPSAGIWVARLLTLRFMFLSGYVKLASGDPTWWAGTALQHHFETQPLPHLLAWYAHQAPAGALQAITWLVLVLELVLPWLVLGPRGLRLVAFVGFVLLQTAILLTGNYNVFNVLTLVLCLSLLDDPFQHRAPGPRSPTTRRAPARLAAAVLLCLGAAQMVRQTDGVPGFADSLLRYTQPFAVANGYGLFAVMTTRRDELIIEGTLDGETWQPYRFPFKPGDLERAPRWAIPHQPRLDWQMWFAVLRGPDQADWIYDFLYKLLEADPAVLRLVTDPFAGAQPEAVRVLVYRYRFTTPDERTRSGAWWVRDRQREWLPPMRLRRPVIRHQPLEL